MTTYHLLIIALTLSAFASGYGFARERYLKKLAEQKKWTDTYMNILRNYIVQSLNNEERK